MKVNLHIYQSEMTRESRIFKTSKTLNDSFDSIFLAGIGSKDLSRKELLFENTTIIRSPHFGISKKIILFFVYYFWAITLLFRIRPAVLSIHSLELLPIAFWAKILRIKVVYDAHELETEKNGMKGIRKKLSKIVERIFIKYCDKVSVVGYEIANFYKEMYPELPKPEVVLNVPYEVKEKDFRNDKFRELFNIQKDDIIFLYQGLLGKGRGIETILKTFQNLSDTSKKVVFMGYGQLEETIKNAAFENDSIFFKDAVSPQVVLEYTASADVGLSLIENTSLSYFYCLPNKLFEYSQVEIPVIVSSNKEMKRVVEEYQIGYVLSENNAESLLKTVREVKKEDLNFFSDKMKAFKIKYNWESQEDTILRLYAF